MATESTLTAARPMGTQDENRLVPIIRDTALEYPRNILIRETSAGQVLIPKSEDGNREWRLRMLEAAEGDPDMQAHLLALCRRDCLFWLNAFAWTYKKRDISATGRGKRRVDPNYPFITWPVQDQLVVELCRAIDEGEDILIDKSRDMGATWIVIAVFTWYFLFQKNVELLLMSRKEDLVDDPGNINSLFGKVDYLISLCPSWMTPRIRRAKLTMVNEDNKCLIDGESTNKSAGRSQRYDAAMLDEFAMVENLGINGMELAASLSDSTYCRIFNSTPKGPETGFSKLRKSGTIPVFVLHWINHPEKGVGRRRIVDRATGALKWTSPWYETECDRRKADPTDIAINLDINHIGAGEGFFEHNILQDRRRRHSVSPRYVGDLIWNRQIDLATADKNLRDEVWESVEFADGGGDKSLKLWCDLVIDPFTNRTRPPQNTAYALAADVGQGTGASNTVIGVVDCTTRKVVAEWAFGGHPPHEAARMMAALALWFGGAAWPPLLVWENNGGGGENFGRELRKTLGYKRLYYDRTSGLRDDVETVKYGWTSSRPAKKLMLTDLRKALSRDELKVPSDQFYSEAESYIWTRSGGIEPADMAMDATARATHGDRVICVGLLFLAMQAQGKFSVQNRHAPPTSIAARRELRKRKRNSKYRARWGTTTAPPKYERLD